MSETNPVAKGCRRILKLRHKSTGPSRCMPPVSCPACPFWDTLHHHQRRALDKKISFRLITTIWAPLQGLLLLWASWATTKYPFSRFQLLCFAASIGINTGVLVGYNLGMRWFPSFIFSPPITWGCSLPLIFYLTHSRVAVLLGTCFVVAGHQHRPRADPQERVAGEVPRPATPLQRVLRPLRDRTPPGSPQERGHPGGSGHSPLQRDILLVPAALGLVICCTVL